MVSGAIVVAFLAGLIVGSFLNVCIVRIPAEESIAFPGSHCPGCGHAIRWYDNIPVLSYLVLGGRCRDCDGEIPVRYPLVEMITGLLFAAIWAYGFEPRVAVLFSILGAGYVAITFIDVDHKIIPDVITIPALWIAPAVALVVGQLTLKSSLIGLAVGGGFLWAIAAGYELVRKQEGMGFGDVKLLAMVGAYQGWEAALFALVIGSVIGTVVGLLLMILRRGRLDMEIPFGPFLVAGALMHMFGGPALLDWYFS